MYLGKHLMEFPSHLDANLDESQVLLWLALPPFESSVKQTLGGD